MRRFDKWARKHKDDKRAYPSWYEWEKANECLFKYGFSSISRAERFHKFDREDYFKIINSLSTKEKSILEELQYTDGYFQTSTYKRLWAIYDWTCGGNLNIAIKYLKDKIKYAFNERSFKRRNFKKDTVPTKYDIYKTYNSWLRVFNESFKHDYVYGEFVTSFYDMNLKFYWHVGKRTELEVFIDRNSLFEHEDTITLIYYYSYSDKGYKKAEELLKEHGKYAVINFLDKFVSLKFKDNWFNSLGELYVSRDFYDDDEVYWEGDAKYKKYFPNPNKTVAEAYPNIKFIKNNYPRLGRGSIVDNYRGFTSLKNLNVGTRFKSQGQEYIVIEKLKEGSTEVLVYVDVKTKLFFGNRVPENSLMYGLESNVISEAWDDLFDCNHVGRRKKYQRDVKIVA